MAQQRTDLANLRMKIHLTIMAFVKSEQAAPKLLKILEPGQEMELCAELLETCMNNNTYEKYHGQLGETFCQRNRLYQENFEECFRKQYSTIHRLEVNQLRNVATFFAHLLGTHALPWRAFAYVSLTKEHTTSSSRVFIKILFQELSRDLGLNRLKEQLSDTRLQDSFHGIFPKDNLHNTQFAIKFFEAISLPGLADNLREYVKKEYATSSSQPSINAKRTS